MHFVPRIVLCLIAWLYLDSNVDIVGDADVCDVLSVHTVVMCCAALISCCSHRCAWLFLLQVPLDIGLQLV